MYLFNGRFLLCQKSGKEWVNFGMVSQQPTLMYYGIQIDQQRQVAGIILRLMNKKKEKRRKKLSLLLRDS